MNSSGGAAALVAASTAGVSPEERALMLALFRKQFSREALAAVAAQAALRRSAATESSSDADDGQDVELCLAQLAAVSITYCWQDFRIEEWEFVLSRLRKWLEGAVVSLEDFTESIVEAVNDEGGKECLEDAVQNIVERQRRSSVDLASTAVSIFSLVREANNLEDGAGTESVKCLTEVNWARAELRAMEDISRLLLATGLAEAAAVALQVPEKVQQLIASARKEQAHLWDSVADIALNASGGAQEAAVRSADVWGLGVSAISGLYALLFSPEPVDSLQWTAYQFLSTEPLNQRAVSIGVLTTSEVEADEKVEGLARTEDEDLFPGVVRPELSAVLETHGLRIHQSPLTSSIRVSVLILVLC